MELQDLAWVVLLAYLFILFMCIVIIFACFAIIKIEHHIKDLVDIKFKELNNDKDSISS